MCEWNAHAAAAIIAAIDARLPHRGGLDHQGSLLAVAVDGICSGRGAHLCSLGGVRGVM
jgi:hypothetical protein